MPTKEQMFQACKPIQDPEIPISIVDLGLIYDATYDADAKKANVKMTFTSPSCPAGPQLKSQVQGRVCDMDDVEVCDVEIVFSPPWTPQKMATKEGKIQLSALGFNIPIED
jgi:metal-sulfur cluster biosynthetic enzyme